MSTQQQSVGMSQSEAKEQRDSQKHKQKVPLDPALQQSESAKVHGDPHPVVSRDIEVTGPESNMKEAPKKSQQQGGAGTDDTGGLGIPTTEREISGYLKEGKGEPPEVNPGPLVMPKELAHGLMKHEEPSVIKGVPPEKTDYLPSEQSESYKQRASVDPRTRLP